VLFVLLGTLAHMILFSGLVNLISFLFYEHTFTFVENLSYTLSQDFYKYILIYGLIAAWIFKQESKTSQAHPWPEKILINSGRKTEAILLNSVFYFSSATPYLEIHLEGKKLLYQKTMKALLEELNPEIFVRIHKSSIVNLQKVKSITSRLNGDYDVFLVNGADLRLSRNYVSGFKAMFEKDTTA